MASVETQHTHANQIAELEQFREQATANFTTLNSFVNGGAAHMATLDGFKTNVNCRLNELESFKTAATTQLTNLGNFETKAGPFLTALDEFKTSATADLADLTKFKKSAEPALKELDRFRRSAGTRLDGLESFQSKADKRLTGLESLKAGERLDRLEAVRNISDAFQSTVIDNITAITGRLDKADPILKAVPGLSTRLTDLEKKVEAKVDKIDLVEIIKELKKPEDGSGDKGRPDKDPNRGSTRNNRQTSRSGGNGHHNVHVDNYGQLQVHHSPTCTRIGDTFRDSFNSRCSCIDSHNTQFPPLPGRDIYGDGLITGILPIGFYPPRSSSPGHRQGHRSHHHSRGHHGCSSDQSAHAATSMPTIHLGIESQGKGGLLSGGKKNNLFFSLEGGGASGNAKSRRSHRGNDSQW